MKRLSKALDYVANIGAAVGGGLGLFMMISVTFEVAYRKFLVQSTRWVMDFAEVSLFFMCFLGITWVLRQDKHIKVDAFTRLLAPRTKLGFDVFTSSVGLFAMGLITVLGTIETLNDLASARMMVKSTIYPRWWASIALPLGTFVMTLGMAARLQNRLARLRSGEGRARPADEGKTAS